jgi:hypothetical protein
LSVGSTEGTQPPPSDDGVWMTKAEIAAVRRISVASADRLVRRQGWRKQPGNDGRARVLVPLSWARPTDNPPDKKPDDPTDKRDVIRLISALESAVSTLQEQLARETARADRAEAGREADQAARIRAEARANTLEAESARRWRWWWRK